MCILVKYTPRFHRCSIGSRVAMRGLGGSAAKDEFADSGAVFRAHVVIKRWEASP